MPDGPLFIAIQTGECTTLLIHMGLACEHCSGRSSVVVVSAAGTAVVVWVGLDGWSIVSFRFSVSALGSINRIPARFSPFPFPWMGSPNQVPFRSPKLDRMYEITNNYFVIRVL